VDYLEDLSQTCHMFDSVAVN